MYSKKIKIYIDGSCLNNGKNESIGGCSYVVITENNVESGSKAFKNTTNNRMEMMGVIEAIEFIEKKNYEYDQIEFYSDSNYLVQTMKGNYKISKNRDLWDRIFKVCKDKNIEFFWIKGHNGDKYNEICDILAKNSYMKGNVIHIDQKL